MFLKMCDRGIPYGTGSGESGNQHDIRTLTADGNDNSIRHRFCDGNLGMH